ncbi:BAX inhibitor (BI)-1/YccA family protein, partial [Escherichia coli]
MRLRCVDAQPHHFAVSLRYSLYLQEKVMDRFPRSDSIVQP